MQRYRMIILRLPHCLCSFSIFKLCIIFVLLFIIITISPASRSDYRPKIQLILWFFNLNFQIIAEGLQCFFFLSLKMLHMVARDPESITLWFMCGFRFGILMILTKLFIFRRQYKIQKLLKYCSVIVEFRNIFQLSLVRFSVPFQKIRFFSSSSFSKRKYLNARLRTR